MQKTGIDYLTHTWNPIAMRCTPVSEGCANCWHIERCDRFARNPKFSKKLRAVYAGDAPPMLVESRLDDPIKRKRPAVIGVQFMGDLFHEDVSDYAIEQIFHIIYLYPAEKHHFLLLTKRPKRMAEIISRVEAGSLCSYYDGDESGAEWITESFGQAFPHVYLGTTVESAAHLDRVEELLKIPGKHWLSLEPLLGPIDISPYLPVDTIGGVEFENWPKWVVLGCESGPDRRPCEHEWMIDIVEQCDAAQVPVYVKQVSINGKVSHNPAEWPEELRRRTSP